MHSLLPRQGRRAHVVNQFGGRVAVSTRASLSAQPFFRPSEEPALSHAEGISRAESRVGCSSVCVLARVSRKCDLVGEQQHNGQSQGFDLPLHLLQFLPLPTQTGE